MKPPKAPCGSCPYRIDTPTGIWSREEYEKLPAYDGETWEQPPQVFMCHQRDGCICGGWLLTHDRDHLLALRLNARHLDTSVWDYRPDVEVFASGRDAADHGISGIEAPSPEAQRKIAGLIRQRDRKSPAC